MKTLLYLTLVILSACVLQAFSAEVVEEPSKDLIDFSSIKDLIKKDGLAGELENQNLILKNLLSIYWKLKGFMRKKLKFSYWIQLKSFMQPFRLMIRSTF